MGDVETTLAEGSGTLPRDLSVGAIVLLAAPTGKTTYEWSMLTKPKTSKAVLQDPISRITRLGPLDKKGVYQVKLLADRDKPTAQTKILAFGVPGQKSTLPDAETPDFAYSGGIINNGSFEFPGPLPGWAALWTTRDDASLLDEHAGVTRGRCIPTNFDTDGEYAMVLGDDIGLSEDIDVGDEFSISQDVDFTNATLLTMDFRYIKR